MVAQLLVAGVDTSTQSCKIRITDARTGALVRFGTALHPGGTSVDPEAWWRAFMSAAAQAGGLDDISAISVGGQQHGMVILDRRGRVIRDALLWNDTRSAPQADELISLLGCDETREGEPEDLRQRGVERWIRAVGSSPVASYTLTKVKWVAQNEPENARRTAAICLPHDWLSWRIAGFGPVADGEDAHLDELFTDRSDASGTSYFDPVRNVYRLPLLDLALGRHDVVLPRVLGPNVPATVKADREIAGAYVSDGCVIAPGGGDNALAALGLSMGIGDVSVSLGTSGVAAVVSERQVQDFTGSISGFADCTGHFLPLACTLNASRILDAACHALSIDYDELSALALAAEPGAGGVTLIPYFDGERTPNRADASASIHGLTMENTTARNLARAFVEAVLCSQRDCVELLRTLGARVSRVLLIGGGAKSPAVRRLAPGVLEMDVDVPVPDEYVAIGAARQAAWVLSGEPDPPSWVVGIECVETSAPQPGVCRQYVAYRS